MKEKKEENKERLKWEGKIETERRKGKRENWTEKGTDTNKGERGRKQKSSGSYTFLYTGNAQHNI